MASRETPCLTWFSLTIRTTCRQCRAPIPLNGPSFNVSCPICEAELPLDPSFWFHVFDSPRTGVSEKRSNGSWMLLDGTLHGHWKVGDPRCPGCGSEIRARQVKPGRKRDWRCRSCGLALQTRPPERGFVENCPALVQVLQAAPGDGGGAPSGVEEPRAGACTCDCPACHGAIEVTASSQRTVACQRCGENIYLPEPLWRDLHPVEPRRSWSFCTDLGAEVTAPDRPQPVQRDGAARAAWGLFEGVPLPATVDGRSVDILLVARTTCKRCSSGIPVNGPCRSVHCPACGSEQELDDAFWHFLLSDPHEECEDAFEEYDGYGELTLLNDTIFAEWHVCQPHCLRCNAPAPRDKVDANPRWCCPECGATLETSRPPDWLQRVYPRAKRVRMAEPAREDADAALATSDLGRAIVVLACPKCSGSLRVDVTSPRIVDCGYCRARVFLPDALWLSLHPAWLSRRWQVRFKGAPLLPTSVTEKDKAARLELARAAIADEWIDVRLEITTQCPHCSARIPLNGPTQEIDCPRCTAHLAIDDHLWTVVFRTAQENWEEHIESYGGGGGWALLTGMLKGKWQLATPVSPDPDRPPTASAPPEWLTARCPQVLLLYGGPDPASAVNGPPEDSDGPDEVLVECPACGGSVRAGATSPRVVICEYCSGDIYLPDSLWQELHPIPQIEQWFVRIARADSQGDRAPRREIQPHRILRLPAASLDPGRTAGATSWLQSLSRRLFGS